MSGQSSSSWGALLLPAIQQAINQALERHCRLGQSVAVMREGQVVVLSPREIAEMLYGEGCSPNDLNQL
jgi:hypothetical protein